MRPTATPFCAECIEERPDLVRVTQGNGRTVRLCAECREGPNLRKLGPMFSADRRYQGIGPGSRRRGARQ